MPLKLLPSGLGSGIDKGRPVGLPGSDSCSSTSRLVLDFRRLL